MLSIFLRYEVLQQVNHSAFAQKVMSRHLPMWFTYGHFYRWDQERQCRLFRDAFPHWVQNNTFRRDQPREEERGTHCCFVWCREVFGFVHREIQVPAVSKRSVRINDLRLRGHVQKEAAVKIKSFVISEVKSCEKPLRIKMILKMIVWIR